MTYLTKSYDKSDFSVAGIIVLYNPSSTTEILENINSYLCELNKLICIDNSNNVNTSLIELIKENDKIEYINMFGNKGLAVALRKGCEIASDLNFDYVIFLDQDTLFDNDCLSIMKQFAFTHPQYSLIAPNIQRIYRNEIKREFSSKTDFSHKNIEIYFAITSGSLIKLKDYFSVGGVDNVLFIAQIDQDLCCKFNKYNKNMIRIGNAIMFQELGNMKSRKYSKLHLPNYTSTRYYYIFRNEVYLRKKWKKDYKHYKVPLYKYFIIILFEKRTLEKIKSIIKGIKDGFYLLDNENNLYSCKK